MRELIVLLAVSAVLVWAAPVWGVTTTFTDLGVGSDWSTAGNWTTGEPTSSSGENVYIGDGLTVNITQAGELASYVRLGRNPGGTGGGTINMSGGDLDVDGFFANGSWYTTDSGAGPGTFIQSGGYARFDGMTVGRQCNGTVTLSGGTLRLTGGVWMLGSNSTATSQFTHTGGLFDISDDTLDVGNDGNITNGVAEYTISDGTLDANGLNVGTSYATSSDSTGTFHVIGDDATITLGSYAQYATATSDPSPAGDNVGILHCEIDPGGISTIAVTGAAAFDGILKVETSVAYAGPYTLMTFGSSSGDFDSDDLPDGWSYQITGGGSGGSLIVVPEPATLVLLGLGGLGVLLRRRRA